MKPKMFIGSSVEGLPVAEAFQQALQYQIDSTVWHQGVFGAGDFTIDGLESQLDSNDMALLVLTADDMVRQRGKESHVPRDNVLLELGMMMARMGRARALYAVPRGKQRFHLPTDLIGLKALEFDEGRVGENPAAAVGPAVTEFKQALVRREHVHRLSGDWVQTWHVNGSSNFPSTNESRVRVVCLGDYFKAEYPVEGIVYQAIGTVSGTGVRHLSGVWRARPDQAQSYNGVFQLKVAATGKGMIGRWMGFGEDSAVKSGAWEWKRP